MIANNPQHTAKTYGIAREPALNTLTHFNIIDGLVPDVMHDLLEGVVPYEVKCLLQTYIQEKIISPREINDRIASFQ